ncbi:MAG TPA: TauD/TfdA family dioxygenase [Pseudonocardiaceae bacterium]|nr:TauD/TfdA family dioxygenase [Pseudonocardiaceae bacterium]
MTITTTAAPERVTFADIELDDTSRDALGRKLLAVGDPTAQPDTSLTQLHQAFAALPLTTLQRIIDFGRHTGAPGVALVRNLPTDPVLPPTPADGGPSTEKATFVAEGNLLGLSGLLGEPVGVTSEKAGQLVHDVIPVPTGATTQTNMGSAVFLNFHNDIVFDHSKIYTVSNPDFLVLSCVRSDPEGVASTYYADARDISAALPTDALDELRKPVFRLNAPGNFCRSVGKAEVYSLPVPLISGPEAFPEVSASANGVLAMTKRGAAAIETLQAVCREVSHAVRLRPGDALLINNRKGLHARSQFTARHDGTDRWLQRSYVRRSLWTIRHRLQDGELRVF